MSEQRLCDLATVTVNVKGEPETSLEGMTAGRSMTIGGGWCTDDRTHDEALMRLAVPRSMR